MSKHDEFVAVVRAFKAASPTISATQRMGLLQQAVREYGLSADDATEILEASGLTIGEEVNYFAILGLSIEDLQDESETDIVTRIDATHEQHYKASLRAGGRVRPDGRTEEQWRILLNDAQDTLKDPEKRREHIVNLQRAKDDAALKGEGRLIFKFSNGAEATDISQLAALMTENPEDATNALYQGYLEQSLGRVGEMHFATAAQAVVTEFPNNRELGRKAMVQILQGKMEFQKGREAETPKQFGQEMEVQKQNEARTPKQLARLIDVNWEQAKMLLYSGFMALWLEYTTHPQLANTAKTITSRYSDDPDVGLEMLVQALDPQIGQPVLEVSHPRIDFGQIDTETQKTIQLEIKNAGRGFLHGDVQFASELPGLQLSSSAIRGEAVVTLELDASHLAVKQLHETELIVQTNSGRLNVPISCYVDYPIWKSIGRILISGIAVALIVLVPRLIVLLFGGFEWLSTRLTAVGLILHGVQLQNHQYFYKYGPWQFIAAFASLCIGIFAYRFFFFKKYGFFFSKKKQTR